MNDRDKTDLWTALAVGAVVGIGAALLLRSADEPAAQGLLRTLRPVQQRARRVAKQAGKQLERGTRRISHRGESLLEQGSETLSELRRDAARIVADARHELEDIAESSLKQARRTARRARRRFA
jgi:gas vesicle protein